MVISVIQEKVMADAILTMHPNLVLLQAGTNDNNEAFNLPPVEPHNTTIDRLENLMNAIFCEVPDTALIVAQIQDNTFGPNNTVRVRQFNSEIPGLVAKKRAQGFQISMVDQFNAVGQCVSLLLTLPFQTVLIYRCSDLDEIGIHPSEKGYNKMAKAWFDGIDSLPLQWVQPAREPHSKAPWSWYMQQRLACNALKGLPLSQES
jgi:lysophospholipase L1-like esterase